MLDFDPNRAPVEPRPAATVIVARSSASDGIELFCVERHKKSGFLGGAVVFPGGKVDDGDRDQEAFGSLTTPLSERAASFERGDTPALAFAVAALRECLEEAAILPVVGSSLSSSKVLELRAALEQRSREAAPGQAFRQLLQDEGLVLDTSSLRGLWRWITPTAEKRRFDTTFFLVEAPDGQEGAHDNHETTKSFWGSPAQLLRRWEAGEIFLAPPTARSLEILGRLSSLEGLDAELEQHELEPICPHLVLADNQTVLALPGDPLYPEKRPLPRDPAAPTRYVLEDTRFVGRRVTG